MEKMFGSMMQEFFKNISDKDGQDMKSRFEKMAAMCPCMNMGAMTEEDKGKMIEGMKSCCGNIMMEKMSSNRK